MFRSIGRFIVTVVDGVAKFFAILLITLGLFIPALYSIAFFAIRLALKAPFDSAAQIVYFLGLGVSLTGAVSFAFYRVKRAKNKRDSVGASQPMQNKVVKKPLKEEFVLPDEGVSKSISARKKQGNALITNDNYYAGNDYSRREKLDSHSAAEYYEKIDTREKAREHEKNDYREKSAYRAKNDMYENTESRERMRAREYVIDEPQYDDAEARDVSYGNMGNNNRERKNKEVAALNGDSFINGSCSTNYSGSNSYGGSGLGADTLWQRLNSAEKPNEKPLVFATRSDANVFVYEYSDRLQYWRRTNKGMILLGTDFKQTRQEKTRR